MATSPTEEPLMEPRHEEPRNLAEDPDLPEQLDDDEAAAPAGGPLRFARMTGSSIAGRDAAAWVTDFLNAAYYRRPVAERQVDDLRLAFSILTTYWYGKRRGRLRITDLPAFHRAYGAHRFDKQDTGRGLMSRDQLLQGTTGLIGDWFPDAYHDDERRGWGIAFATAEEKAAYDPERRFKLAKLGALTPERAPVEQQVWHTYSPVQMPSAEAVIGALIKPETWPDYASELGRFTPLRAGGLADQTFEIEVAAGTESGVPIFTRGYVTITKLVTPDDPAALADWFDKLEDGLARYGDNEPRAVPEGATPLVGFDLTTHEGHFMGAGHNRLLLYVQDGQAWVRAAGTWDPMAWHVDKAYAVAGRDAQHAFWGQVVSGDDSPERVERLSMLHQLALRIA
jgi:hypothetical protein